MEQIKAALRTYLETTREQLARVRAAPATEVAALNSRHVTSGTRGLPLLLCETSHVSPDTGLSIRGHPIKEVSKRLPEEAFGLLLTGSWPEAELTADIGKELTQRCRLPDYLWRVVEALPANSHPMALLNTAVLALEPGSVFAKRYADGLEPDAFWEATLEDVLSLLGKLPCLAGYIYRRRTQKGPISCCATKRDWASGYAHMLGLPDSDERMAAAVRLLCVVHCDHGGGNVAALASSVVNAALADVYLALSAGLNGLAGPLDGLASHQCVHWLQEVGDRNEGEFNAGVWEQAVDERLAAKRPVPGFGHAVLRCVDPRFEILAEFARAHFADAPLIRAALRAAETVPEILRQKTRIRDPNPNVDLISGPLMHACGLQEPEYHAVLISVGRALGVCAQAVIARGLGLPMLRPDSMNVQQLQSLTQAP